MMEADPDSPNPAKLKISFEHVLFLLAIVCLVMTLFSAMTGKGNIFVLVVASGALFALATGSYFYRVQRTYLQCLYSEGAANTGYERMHYRNGLRGINEPPAGKFFARAAWRAGRDVAARNRKSN